MHVLAARWVLGVVILFPLSPRGFVAVAEAGQRGPQDIRDVTVALSETGGALSERINKALAKAGPAPRVCPIEECRRLGDGNSLEREMDKNRALIGLLVKVADVVERLRTDADIGDFCDGLRGLGKIAEWVGSAGGWCNVVSDLTISRCISGLALARTVREPEDAAQVRDVVCDLRRRKSGFAVRLRDAFPGQADARSKSEEAANADEAELLKKTLLNGGIDEKLTGLVNEWGACTACYASCLGESGLDGGVDRQLVQHNFDTIDIEATMFNCCEAIFYEDMAFLLTSVCAREGDLPSSKGAFCQLIVGSVEHSDPSALSPYTGIAYDPDKAWSIYTVSTNANTLVDGCLSLIRGYR